MASQPIFTITHEDGSAVTPQEVYDAFMSGTVIFKMIEDGVGSEDIVLGIRYEGTPDNVTSCVAYTYNTHVMISG